jgi:aminopeptidase
MRFVEVGNGLYPTAWRARRFGMSHEALTQKFWQSVNVDYSNLQKRGEQIKAVLAAGKELRVRNSANGTDLRMSIAGRPLIVSDGIISAADVKQGGAAVSVFLPAGDVMTTPVQGMADGRIVAQQLYFEGQPVQDLTLTFTNGKLKSMSGRGEGYAALKARYDATDDPDKALLGFVDFGINEKIQLPPTSHVGTWVAAGMVTIGVGNNIFFGGDNDAPFSLAAHLPGVTVTLDGKTIVEGGRLKL